MFQIVSIVSTNGGSARSLRAASSEFLNEKKWNLFEKLKIKLTQKWDYLFFVQEAVDWAQCWDAQPEVDGILECFPNTCDPSALRFSEFVCFLKFYFLFLTLEGSVTCFVTEAKYCISFLILHGNVPFFPIPPSESIATIKFIRLIF